MAGQDGILSVAKQVWREWQEDNDSLVAGALAYYTLVSLAPVLIVAVTVAGVVLGRSEVQSRVLEQVTSIAGADVAGLVGSLLTNANTLARTSGVVASIVALVTLLLGASGVFTVVRDALDLTWNVTLLPTRGWAAVGRAIKRRLFAMALVLGAGFLLLLSVVAGAVLSSVAGRLGSVFGHREVVWQVLNVALTFVVAMAAFSAVLKLVPDVVVAWRDVAVGAAATALVFSVGRYAISLYLGRSTVASAYGAAGAVVALLVWIYYSAVMFLLGAQFTHVYAERQGAVIRPTADAVMVPRAPEPGAPERPAASRGGRRG